MPNPISSLIFDIIESKVIVKKTIERDMDDFLSIGPEIVFNRYKEKQLVEYSTDLDEKLKNIRLVIYDNFLSLNPIKVLPFLESHKQELENFIANYIEDRFDGNLNGKGNPLTHPNIKFVWQSGEIAADPNNPGDGNKIYNINTKWNISYIKKKLKPFINYQITAVTQLLEMIDRQISLFSSFPTDNNSISIPEYHTFSKANQTIKKLDIRPSAALFLFFQENELILPYNKSSLGKIVSIITGHSSHNLSRTHLTSKGDPRKTDNCKFTKEAKKQLEDIVVIMDNFINSNSG